MTAVQGAPGVRAGGSLPLPRPPGVVRRFARRHPRLVDWLLAVGPQLPILLVGTIAAATNADFVVVGLVSVAVSIVCGAALLYRRHHPLAVALLCAALLLIPSEMMAGAFLAVYVALYSLGAYARTLHVWIGVGAAAVTSTLSGLILTTLDQQETGTLMSVSLVGIVSFTVPALIGTSVRARRSYVDALIARADDTIRERDQQSQLAVAAERARIAREMHDVVSHGLTVMVTLAEGSAAQAARDPARASDTMRRVADTGRESLAEMRRLLGVLREPGDDVGRAPQPAAGDLQALVASFRDLGMPVRVTTSGAAIGDQAIALTVHRIVQESLTNAMRHASDAARVEVTVRHDDDAVRIEVVDDGTGAPATMTGAGRGLVGIRERAAMFGGTVDAGPRAPTGWRIVVTLHEAQPAASGAATNVGAASAPTPVSGLSTGHSRHDAARAGTARGHTTHDDTEQS